MPRHPFPLIAGTAAVLALVTAGAALGADETAVRGTAPFQLGQSQGLRHVALSATTLSAKRVGSTVRLQVKNPADRVAVTTVRSGKQRSVPGLAALPMYWRGLVGNRPTVRMQYTIDGAKRTHVLRGGGLPKWSAKAKTFQVQFNATPENVAVLRRMRASGARNVSVRVYPTPAGYGAFVPGSHDPKVSKKNEAQTSTDAVNPFPPPAPNAPFTLPYTSALGSGGQSWVNYLTATGETTGSCEVYPYPSNQGGNAQTTGAIFVYQDAAAVQSDLNIGGSIAYKQGRSSASLSGAYSTSSTQDTSSLYAVAIVNFQGGVVNLGQPSLQSKWSTSALQSVTSYNGALAFMQQCGDAFPTSYTTGASWMSVLRITLSSATQAQSVSANMKMSYGGTSAGANFSGDLSKQTSSAQIIETDECWGPANCFAVNGYAASATTDMSAALTQFQKNYTAMLTGLSTACNPSSSASGCITSVSYKPLSNIMPTTTSASYMQQAAFGVYGVNQNLNAWHSEYQALVTGNPASSSVPTWNTATTNLNNQGLACSIANLSTNSACAQRFNACWNSSQQVYSYLNPSCLPSAFSSNYLYGVANPFQIAGTPQQDLIN
jgi:hypothetical protein